MATQKIIRKYNITNAKNAPMKYAAILANEELNKSLSHDI